MPPNKKIRFDLEKRLPIAKKSVLKRGKSPARLRTVSKKLENSKKLLMKFKKIKSGNSGLANYKIVPIESKNSLVAKKSVVHGKTLAKNSSRKNSKSSNYELLRMELKNSTKKLIMKFKKISLESKPKLAEKPFAHTKEANNSDGAFGESLPESNKFSESSELLEPFSNLSLKMNASSKTSIETIDLNSNKDNNNLEKLNAGYHETNQSNSIGNLFV